MKNKNYKPTATEIKESLLSFGGFSGEYEQIGANVVIADGEVVVIIKLLPDSVNTVYPIRVELFNDDWFYNKLEGKVWATDEVLSDIHLAEIQLQNK